jgi:dTDP-glucose pyrophosphorylase
MIGIIPCAGVGSRFHELGKCYPKCILPYEEAPLLVKNVEWMINNGCEKIYLITDHKQDKIQETVLNYKLPVEILTPENKGGLSVSIHRGLKELSKDDEVLILLGDLLVKTNFNISDCNWVGVIKVSDWSRWCMFDVKSNKFYEKPTVKPNTDKALSGVYFLKSGIKLRESIEKQIDLDIKVNGELTLSSALSLMNEDFDSISLDIVDFGSIDQYLKNRKIKKSRTFNDIRFEDHFVIKSSSQKHKIYLEYNWYKSIPNNLKVFTPKILDHDFYQEKSEYTMEKINLPSLRELYLFFDRSIETWSKIFNSCLDVYKKMSSYSYSYSSFSDIYKKTEQRVLEVKTKEKALVDEFLKDFYEIGNEIDKTTHLFHGDYIFSNLFWDEIKSSIIMIDPRGQLFGSKYYDWAKLKHSVNYHYDFVDGGLYALNDGKYQLFNDGCSHIENIFNQIEEKLFTDQERHYLKILTASLFISEIPLHYHNRENQEIYFKIFKNIYENL